MREFSRSRLILTLLLACLALPADVAAPKSPLRVAILLTSPADPYQDALRGFEQSIQHEIVAQYDMRNQNDVGRDWIKSLRTDVKPDLVLAVGVYALELTIREELDVPVVYTMVLNPRAIVGSQRHNITGASLNVPVERSLHLLKNLSPEIRRIGVFFNPANSGYLVASAKKTASQLGLEVVAIEVRSTREAVSAVESLKATRIDALLLVPDQTVMANQGFLKHLLRYCHKSRVPLVSYVKRHTEMGALASFYFASSEDIGKQAGELAKRALARPSFSSVAPTMAREVNLIVNLKIARKLGIGIPDRVLADADEVIE